MNYGLIIELTDLNTVTHGQVYIKMKITPVYLEVIFTICKEIDEEMKINIKLQTKRMKLICLTIIIYFNRLSLTNTSKNVLVYYAS